MKIEQWKLSEITPYENNPRQNAAAVDAVAASIKEFGFRQPIVVDTQGVIICGHTRYKAAQKLGLEKVPVHVAKDLTPAQIKAYRIADNKTADLAVWDYELLPIELSELKGMDFDLGLLGFSPDELAEMLDTGVKDGLTDPDEIPEPPDEATTKPGDLWILGDHRLLCGDSSIPEYVDRLLGGEKIQLVNTDPPYNVAVAPRSNNAWASGEHRGMPRPELAQSYGGWNLKEKAEGGKPQVDKKMRARDRVLANDFVSDEEFNRLLDAWFGNIARVLEPGRSYYCWGGYSNLSNYPPFLKKHGLYFSQGIVWDKGWPVLGRKDFMGAFELCFYGWREGAGHKFFGPNNVTDLWHVKKINPQSMVHLTEKPVELAIRAIQYSSHQGENVLDLFGGSGSTLVAAEQTGRKAFLMELDALYCDVIVERYEQFTGRKAERANRGSLTPEPFNDCQQGASTCPTE